jgi:putative redox protein
MVQMRGKYLGNKKLELLHEPSGTKIYTAAPKDNNGDGSSFSPTDLAAVSLGACILTVMGIFAERHAIDLTGSHFSIEKVMSSNPRRIAELPISIHLPKSIAPEMRETLERVAHTCPVHQSLHPEIQVRECFVYDV